MNEYFAPDDVKNFMSRATSDRQRIILFLGYNYGITIQEMLQLKAGHFMVGQEAILFNFSRAKTEKKHTYKVQHENYRLLYRVLNRMQAHEPLLHKDKMKPVSEALIKKDLFDLAVIVNRKVTPSSLFDSHLYWVFRRGVSYAQAVEEYGVSLTGKPFSIWEKANLDGRIWPFLLE